ncbi:757_t:CDS:2 [Acaulospora morrowiae]|uniref:757_t:CDS:1 n=1 Tax=Acaulospora morrowiae TaxID=94023 RepID=A0A9N8ZNU0_9GLOM|nr:757_t:CDS:2 [Acaulospora morrowiae]
MSKKSEQMPKRSYSISNDLPIISIVLIIITTKVWEKENKIHRDSRRKDLIWNNFNIKVSDGNGYYGASCKYCAKARWQRGIPQK